MDGEIKSFIEELAIKTGVEVSVYDLTGKYLAGKSGEKSVPAEFSGVEQSLEAGKTLFFVKCKGKKYICALDGDGEVEKKYAYLVKELIENAFYKDAGMSKADFYKAVLVGETTASQTARYMKKFAVKDCSAFVMLINLASGKKADVLGVLESYGEEGRDFAVDIGDEQLAFVKFLEEEAEEYQSANEYAEFLMQSIYEETGVSVKIAIGGTVKSLVDLSLSYSQAIATFRMVNAVSSKGEIHSFKEFVLIKMLEDLPKYKLNEYLETLLDYSARDIFTDDEMINTAEEFLQNSLNLSETSRKLYLHRNTLTYRLDKIEKETGLNIRKFSDAVTFRLITILSKLIR
jgi:carbohydrate diacid regulator